MTASSLASITCPACATTSTVPIDALLISVADDDPEAPAPDSTTSGAGPTAAHVTWTCQPCADLTTTDITWPMLLTLVAAGATLFDEPHGPDDLELPEHPEHPADGATLTPDDLLALHELLATDTWFAQLSTSPGVQQ